MNNQKSVLLDDVLDFYLISSEETGTDTLAEVIKAYPQYEYDLRELSAFRNLQESTPERAYTIEEEAALKDRAVGIVKAVLRGKQSKNTKEVRQC